MCELIFDVLGLDLVYHVVVDIVFSVWRLVLLD
jgi:hypothetical protein